MFYRETRTISADHGGTRYRLEFPVSQRSNLLRFGYLETERFKVQSFNDFLVFSIQGVASLSSGWFLYHWGWKGVLAASLPLVLLFAILAWSSRGFMQKSLMVTENI